VKFFEKLQLVRLVMPIKAIQPRHLNRARPRRLGPDGLQNRENLLWSGFHFFLTRTARTNGIGPPARGVVVRWLDVNEKQ
jgi:hypothetical protein